MRHDSAKGHSDFRRLWTGLTISQLGSAVGQVALPVVAVRVLHVSSLQLSLLATFAAVTAALLALPIGSYVEYRHKRPIMIIANVGRFAAIASVPVAYAWHSLTYTQLAIVAVVNAVCQVSFVAAAAAHLKALVPANILVDANSRLQAATWMNITAGPLVGGFLIAIVAAPFVMVIDALSFAVDALVLRRLRTPEPAPPPREPQRSRLSDAMAGLKYVWRHSTLRPILLSWVLFTGASGMVSPLTTYYYLNSLHFTNFEYGLLMGIPSLGGVIGARLTTRAVSRFGSLRTLRWAAVLRSPYAFVIALAMPGIAGLVVCGLAFAESLLFSSMANASMASYRLAETPDRLVSRVGILWTFASLVTQPLTLPLGGLIATHLHIRAAIVSGGILMAVSAWLLPRSPGSGGTPQRTPQQPGTASAPATTDLPARDAAEPSAA